MLISRAAIHCWQGSRSQDEVFSHRCIFRIMVVTIFPDSFQEQNFIQKQRSKNANEIWRQLLNDEAAFPRINYVIIQ